MPDALTVLRLTAASVARARGVDYRLVPSFDVRGRTAYILRGAISPNTIDAAVQFSRRLEEQTGRAMRAGISLSAQSVLITAENEEAQAAFDASVTGPPLVRLVKIVMADLADLHRTGWKMGTGRVDGRSVLMINDLEPGFSDFAEEFGRKLSKQSKGELAASELLARTIIVEARTPEAQTELEKFAAPG